MFLINLFLKLYVRKARTLSSTMGNQSIEKIADSLNAQLHNLALG